MANSDDYQSAYFCILGDVDDYALDQPGSFVIVDRLGRNWVCFELSADPEQMVLDVAIAEQALCEMQRSLIAGGLASAGGSRVVVQHNFRPPGYSREEDLRSLRASLA